MKRSSFFGLIAFMLGFCGLGLALIALATTRWQYNISTGAEKGLWESCVTRLSGCTAFIADGEDWEIASAAFMLAGGVVSLAAVIVSIFIGCGRTCNKKGRGCKLHILAGWLYFISALFICVSPAVYTATLRDAANSDIEFGFSIWLAWASFIITLLASPIAFCAGE